MGTIRHDAIVLTGDPNVLRQVRDRAAQHFGGSEVAVGEITRAGVNNTASFLIAPDGSKEGWADSDTGDRLRDAFVKWLQVEAPLIDWIEVNFGGDKAFEAFVRTPHDSKFRRVPPADKKPSDQGAG